MISGMYGHQLYMNIQKIKAAGSDIIESFPKLFKDSLRGISFIESLLVSLIVFLGVLKVISGIESLLMVILFSFQNGFFWQTMFSANKPKTVRKRGNS